MTTSGRSSSEKRMAVAVVAAKTEPELLAAIYRVTIGDVYARGEPVVIDGHHDAAWPESMRINLHRP